MKPFGRRKKPTAPVVLPELSHADDARIVKSSSVTSATASMADREDSRTKLSIRDSIRHCSLFEQKASKGFSVS